MNSTIFQNFRRDVYHCFDRAADPLFQTIDALIASSHAQSFPELSLSPFFERGWSSLYKAFKRGRIDRKQLQNVFIKYLPPVEEGKRLVLAIDATSIERPCSQTSPDRTAVPMHNIPSISKTKKGTPITFGWQYSTVTVLPEKTSSWTYILDQQRIPSNKTATQVAFEQLKEIVPKLPTRPLIVLDRGYVCLWFWCQLSLLPIDALCRLKSNQCFYQPAPPRTNKGGRPREHGTKLKLDELSTQKHPDRIYEMMDANGHPVTVRCWQQMHARDAKWLEMTIVQVIRPHATDSERDPRISWFAYIGQDQEKAIAQIALLYGLRFSQEHGYRFDKQALLWTDARLQTPDQFDRWSHIVAVVHNHLVLARDFAPAVLRPWENKHRDPSPQHVRRGLAMILSDLGTPARPPRLRGYSQGRTKGTKLAKRKRHPVVRKKPSLPQLVST